MPAAIGQPGDRYGRLVLVSYTRGTRARPGRWLCRCDCGTEKAFQLEDLRRRGGAVHGKTLSCGCLRRELLSARRKIHGLSQRDEYEAWRNARSRCTNPRNAAWKDYGGRGIRMCTTWCESFEAFFEHMGPCPAGLTLDRINNEGDYEPGNCRWATHSEQQFNRRSAAR